MYVQIVSSLGQCKYERPTPVTTNRNLILTFSLREQNSRLYLDLLAKKWSFVDTQIRAQNKRFLGLVITILESVSSFLFNDWVTCEDGFKKFFFVIASICLAPLIVISMVLFVSVLSAYILDSCFSMRYDLSWEKIL